MLGLFPLHCGGCPTGLLPCSQEFHCWTDSRWPGVLGSAQGPAPVRATLGPAQDTTDRYLSHPLASELAQTGACLGRGCDHLQQRGGPQKSGKVGQHQVGGRWDQKGEMAWGVQLAWAGAPSCTLRAGCFPPPLLGTEAACQEEQVPQPTSELIVLAETQPDNIRHREGHLGLRCPPSVSWPPTAYRQQK